MIRKHKVDKNTNLKLIPYFKKCSKCGLKKIITDFQWSCHVCPKYKKIYCYWSSICRVCDAKRRRKYYFSVEKKNGSRETEEFYKKNREQCRQYYWKNVEILGKKWNESNKKSREKHGKKWDAHRREYYRLHLEELRKRNNKWSKLNRSKIRQRVSVRRKQDPFKYNIKEYISKSLKGNKAGRHWEDLVGYTLSELKIHLEKQFKLGMNWDNYGAWHVDHIKPQSFFSFTQPEDSEFLECWSLNNLQPLWASQNCSKGNRILVAK